MAKRQIIKFGIDLFCWVLATPLAYLIRLENEATAAAADIGLLVLISLPVKALCIHVFGLYRRSWYRTSLRDLSNLMFVVGAVTVPYFVAALVNTGALFVPRSVPVIEMLLAILFMGGARLVVRVYYEQRGIQEATWAERTHNVLIVGAGEAGTMVAREMLRHPRAGRRPIGFLDDDLSKHRQRYLGLRVLGTIADLGRVVNLYRVDEVLIAIPSEGGALIRRVVGSAQNARVKYRIIPGMYELLSGKVSVSQTREVDVEDLLKRKPVRLETDKIESYLKGKVVLVTGAGGSIGSEMVRQVAGYGPERIVLLGRGENSIFSIDRELARTHPHVDRKAVITDIRDGVSLEYVFQKYHPQVVFHAAAHKHVPLMEESPEQAVFNNVEGTRNLVRMATHYGVDRFVNISTDKAVNPTSFMGCSKRVSELIVQDSSKQVPPGRAFVSVRFGNVLGSRGSVIPVFKEQIQHRAPITVTHPEMKRYFMTIPEATQLVLQAGALGGNGYVYVLDMGEPVRIVDLAEDLIRLSGLEPDVDVPIVFTGIRCGEKLFEELLLAEEGTIASPHEKILVARNKPFSGDNLNQLLDDLVAAARRHDRTSLSILLKTLVPTFRRDPAHTNGKPLANGAVAHHANGAHASHPVDPHPVKPPAWKNGSRVRP